MKPVCGTNDERPVGGIGPRYGAFRLLRKGVATEGIEPTTRAFSGPRSTD